MADEQKQGLVTSLTNLASSLRASATLAENYALMLEKSEMTINPMAPLALMNTLNQLYQNPTAFANAQNTNKRSPDTSEDGAPPKKRKRETKPKDPNAPKRPPSAYIIFQNEIRKQIKEKNPNLSSSDIQQELSRIWSGLADGDKKKYTDANQIAKGEYIKLKTAYDKQIQAAGSSSGQKQVVKADVPTTNGKLTAKQASAAKVSPHRSARQKSPDEQSSDEEDSSTSGEANASGSDDASSGEDNEDDDDDEPPAKKVAPPPAPPKVKSGKIPKKTKS